MIRLIFIFFLGYLVYKVVKAGLSAVASSGGSRPHAPGGGETAEMVMDPQCGTYFLKTRGVIAHIGGRTLLFCSKECLDAYVKDNERS
jgi:YHS domain-containing protein